MRHRRLLAGLALALLIASCQLLPQYDREASPGESPATEATEPAAPTMAEPTGNDLFSQEPPRGPSPSLEIPPPRY
jgi:hypothetical protein